MWPSYKMDIVWCMGATFCVKFATARLKSGTKIWTHTLQNIHFTDFYFWARFTIFDLWRHEPVSETGPWTHLLALATHVHTVKHLHMSTTQYYTNVAHRVSKYVWLCLHIATWFEMFTVWYGFRSFTLLRIFWLNTISLHPVILPTNQFISSISLSLLN